MDKLENKYKFNDGTELESKEFSDGSGLDLYATEFRSYDPQIGRFLLIDLLAEFNEFWTPYNYFNNNPIIFNDPLGLDTVGVVGKISQLPATPGQEVKLINTNGGTSSYIYDPNNPNADKNGLVENGMTDQPEEAVVVTAKKSTKSAEAQKTPWTDKAGSQLGVTEDLRPGKSNPDVIKYHSTTGKFKDDAVPWCASFVNWCFVQSNISSLNHQEHLTIKIWN